MPRRLYPADNLVRTQFFALFEPPGWDVVGAWYSEDNQEAIVHMRIKEKRE